MSSKAQVGRGKIDYAARFLEIGKAILQRSHGQAAAKDEGEPVSPPQTSAQPNGGEVEQATSPAWLVTAEELEAIEREEEERQALRNTRVKVRVDVERLYTAAELLDLKKYRPKRGRGAGTEGAGALARLLNELSCAHLQARPYLCKNGKLPPQVVLHLSNEMVAEVLGVSDNTVREWGTQLAADGFLDSRPHYTTSKGRDGENMTMVDGTLYAVRMTPGQTARLRYRDLHHEYRDLDADRAAGRTAYNAIRNAHQRAENRAAWKAEQAALGNADPDAGKNSSGSSITPEGEAREEILSQLRRWAVIPGDIDINPVTDDPELFQTGAAAEHLNTLLDVAHPLSLLSVVHHTKRASLVGILGSALARVLNDRHSRAFYCRLIWDAWEQELMGMDGLQALTAQLIRLEVDRREWKELRNPAALLAYRMRAA